MNKRGSCILGCIATVVVSIALVVAAVLAYFSYSNREIDLRNRIEAQQQQCEIVFDQVWKVISQQGQIAEEYKDSFREVFVEIMDARYQQGQGRLMAWIQEKNPDFDPRFFDKLMNTVEEQRALFTREQKALIAMAQEHKAMLERFPGSFLLANRKPVEIRLVTSARTDKAFETGQDNDVQLFEEK